MDSVFDASYNANVWDKEWDEATADLVVETPVVEKKRRGRPKKEKLEEKVETLSLGGDCNTSNPPASDKKPSKNQPNQLIFWCFTFNNFHLINNSVETLVAYFEEHCKWYVFQHEVGGNSELPHLQGCICLKKENRWSNFGLPKQIHWAKTEDIEAQKRYCMKLDYVGGRVRNDAIWCSKDIHPPQEEIIHWVSWNTYLRDCIIHETEKRKIFWFWSEGGKMGKTSFTRWLIDKFGAQFCSGGKYSDICNLVFHTDMEKTPVVIFTLPREHKNHVSYSALESIKDRLVCNMKSFKNGSKKWNRNTHVIVFGNYPPDMSKLSADRWIIHNVDYMREVKK